MAKTSMWRAVVLLTIGSMLIIAASAQSSSPMGDPSLDAYIDAIRADLRSDKINVITETMQFNDKDAAVF